MIDGEQGESMLTCLHRRAELHPLPSLKLSVNKHDLVYKSNSHCL